MTNPFNGHMKPLLTRLAEAAVIGGIIMFGMVQTLGKDVEYLKGSMVRIESEVKQIRNDFYVPRYHKQNTVLQHPALQE